VRAKIENEYTTSVYTSCRPTLCTLIHPQFIFNENPSIIYLRNIGINGSWEQLKNETIKLQFQPSSLLCGGYCEYETNNRNK